MATGTQSYHYNRNYSIWGLVLLLLMAAGIYTYISIYHIQGGIYLSIIPFFLGVLMLAYYTGQPCLIILKTHLYYRRFPFGWPRIIVLDDILKVDISGKEIKIFCAGQTLPIRITSATFSKRELPEVTDYFQRLSARVLQAQM